MVKNLLEQRHRKSAPRKDQIDYNLYGRIHYWLRQNYGKADCCEGKSCEGKSKSFQWALKEGASYDFKRENFMKLCKSCHSKQDFTEEGKRRLRLAQAKPVLQFTLAGVLVARYPSFREAAKQTGIKSASHALRGAYKKAGGYVWKYETQI